ncbi:DUF2145 domain-containing protein [Paucibacter sp. KCTC 42545]|uniref:DUF2145 domain-containing protein n=1 Tax=Paucibacter sp. KCTC 42545 TaxID=1768242 RepID=UPI000733A5BF|nr:DUF2145 domain-containing protein [Paucibacter sp. KCTC 42545]ALT78173.1 hypothetical protein AT984_14250 [Paucibacter sp. KCTC 42545]
MRIRGLRAAALLCAALAVSASAHADLLGYCGRQAPMNAAAQDKLLRFTEIVKIELSQSGQGMALISRSGLDLTRFGQRYSHAGLSLRDSENAPWSVRQLYFSCDEGRPRIYDQGMAGFLLGTNDPKLGYVSLVFLPEERSAQVARAALDKPLSLQLLSPNYSANAYAFGLQYQNCNQWVAELLAASWAGAQGAQGADGQSRAAAQDWLKSNGYQPTVMAVNWRPMMWLGAFIPWVHSDDHPEEDLAQLRFRVSMPSSLEALIQAQAPGAQRVEMCHTETQVVIRRGWAPIAEGCVAEPQDSVIALN